MPAREWEFTQLAGERKVLRLSGWSAPFGRPRSGAIVNAGLTVRTQATYYSGNTRPTVHEFGDIGKPWDLHGRFMDSALNIVGGAQLYQRTWKDFVSDHQPVRAKWGEVLSYQIFINDIDINFEGTADVAWALKAIVLLDEAQVVKPDIPVVKSPFALASQLKDLQGDLQKKISPPGKTNILNILPQVSDLIDSIFTTLNAPFAFVYQVCSSLSDFTTALSTDLGKVGAGLQLMKTGLLNLRDATDLLYAQAASLAVTNSALFGILSGPDMVRLTKAKAETDADIANLLALIASMQDQVRMVTRGTKAKAVQANDQDTWESLATRTLGGPDGARAIRDMNNIRGGTKPIPGKTYTVPFAAR